MTNDSLHVDKLLITRLRQDDRDAFTELYHRYWQRVFSIAYSVLRDEEMARDIVQEIFVSLWERRHETAIDFPLAYLKQAAKFQVFKAIRMLSRRHAFYDRLTKVSTEIITEEPMLFKDLSHLVEDLLRQLPDNQRLAFVYSRDHGMSYQQIAQEMNISVKTVEKYISKTLKFLRLKLHDSILTFFL